MGTIVDRGEIDTEKINPASKELHLMDTKGCIDIMNKEDKKVLSAIEAAKNDIVAFIDDILPSFIMGGRLIYLGAGTSGRLGVLDASEVPPTFQEKDRIIGLIAGGDTALRKSSEAREDDTETFYDELDALELTSDDAVLGISAGGTTPCVHGALEYVKHKDFGIKTGLLTCANTDVSEYIDHLISLSTGPEIIAGSTRMKAGSATKMVLNMVSSTLMIQIGKVYQNLMVDVNASNDKLKDRAARILVEVLMVDREKAFDILDKAKGSVKTAIVMHMKDIDIEEAVELIGTHDGRLDRVL